MANLYRVRVTWTGMPGAPGVSTHYLDATPTAGDLTAIRSFYFAFAASLPATATLQVQGTGDVVDETDGALTDTWTAAAPSVVAGSGAGVYSAPAGMLVHWLTAGAVDGRRLRGTTFIVPLVGQQEANGTISAAIITVASGAAAAMITALATHLVVWHRPTFGDKPGPGIPRPVIRVGAHRVVTAASVPDKTVVLRSRRD